MTENSDFQLRFWNLVKVVAIHVTDTLCSKELKDELFEAGSEKQVLNIISRTKTLRSPGTREEEGWAKVLYYTEYTADGLLNSNVNGGMVTALLLGYQQVRELIDDPLLALLESNKNLSYEEAEKLWSIVEKL